MRLVSARAVGLLWRALFASAFAGLCGFLAVNAGKEALSDIYFNSALREVELAKAEPAKAPGRPLQISPGDRWMRGLKSLSESLRYRPDNPWALEELGAHNMRRMRTAAGTLPMIAVTGANINYRMALKQRPTSPIAWANLALTKFLLNQIDDELFKALRFADEAGPNEFAVQEVVVFLGINLWDKLDAAQRSSALRTLDRAARRDAAKTAKFLQDHNRIELLCGLKNPSVQMQEQCSRLKSVAGRPTPRFR